MFSCVDNITRMQVALSASRQEHDIPVTLKTESGQFRSRWFVRENGYLLEASRGLQAFNKNIAVHK
nr:type VI secretion system-associated protein TagO [Citrobacter freundii]